MTTLLSQYNSDYEAISTVFNFTNTSLEQNISLTINNDELLENNEEEFMVILERLNRTDNCVILQPDSATVTILDNDSKDLSMIKLYRLHLTISCTIYSCCDWVYE